MIVVQDGSIPADSTDVANETASRGSRARRLATGMTRTAPAYIPEETKATAMMAPELTEASRIFKRNDLVNARFKLSLNAHRLLSMYLAMLPKKFDVPPLLSIPLVQICETYPAFRRGGTGYADVELAVNELFEAKIDVGREVTSGGVRWAPTCARVGNVVLLSLNHTLTPYLQQMNERGRFTTYHFRFLLELRTANQFRFYEMFTSYAYLGNVTLYFDELKDWLMIPSNEYKLVGHFVNRVIEPTLVAINAATDLNVTIKGVVREGKRIIGWHFAIKRKPPEALPLAPSSGPLIERLVGFGLGYEEAQVFAREYDEEMLLSTMAFVDHEIAEGNVESPAGFLRSAIKGNWQAEPTPEAILSAKKQKAVISMLDAERRAEHRERIEKAQHDAAWELQVEGAKAILVGLPKAEREEFDRAFHQHLLDKNNGPLLRRYQDKGLDDYMVAPLYRVFMVDYFKVQAPSISAIQERLAAKLAVSPDPDIAGRILPKSYQLGG